MQQIAVGDILEGKVTGITKFGAFIEISKGKVGMVHISEVASSYVKEITDYIKENDSVRVKVLNIAEDGKISLSIKQALEQTQQVQPVPRSAGPRAEYVGKKVIQPMTFEDMMTKFKQASDDKMSDLKKSMDVKRGSSHRRNPK